LQGYFHQNIFSYHCLTRNQSTQVEVIQTFDQQLCWKVWKSFWNHFQFFKIQEASIRKSSQFVYHDAIACSRHIYMGVVLCTHPSRGELHIQYNGNGEVATTSPPIYNEPHRLHVLFVKAAPSTTFTSWSQHHFVAIGKPEQQVRKAIHCGNKQQ